MRKKTFKRSWLVVVLATGIGLGVGLGSLIILKHEPKGQPVLLFALADTPRRTDSADPTRNSPSAVVPDDLRLKFDPLDRVAFHLTSSGHASILVWATGVQVLTESGWTNANEEYRGETWRLKQGAIKEVCVERPSDQTWRAYVRYGKELKGLWLLKAQLTEAWKERSLSNWTGRAWGGGRWAGTFHLYSDELDQ